MYMLYSSHNNDNCCLKIATLWEYAMHSIQACETMTMQVITQACELSNETVYFSVQIDGNLLVLLLCFSQTREL